MPMISRRHAERLLWQGAALGMALLFVAPLLWVVTGSLRPAGMPPPHTLEWFPPQLAWANYTEIFRIVPLGRQIANSLLVSALGAGLTLVTASWAGFAMAQMPAPVRRGLVGIAVALLLVLFTALGLLDTYAALIAPAVMGTKSLYVLMFYWSFRRVPAELFEAAWLDGAGAWTSWRRLALPMAGPTLLAVALLAFSHYWSDFVDPLLFLKSAWRYTLAVGLRMLQQMDLANWSLLLAAVVVMSAPVVLIYLLLQRTLRDAVGLGKFLRW
jgi:multiple sugar transport system permease protein